MVFCELNKKKFEMTERVASSHSFSVGSKPAAHHWNGSAEEDSWLAPFFGSNVAPPRREKHGQHLCAAQSREVHECLDRHQNAVNRCFEFTSKLELCLRDA